MTRLPNNHPENRRSVARSPAAATAPDPLAGVRFDLGLWILLTLCAVLTLAVLDLAPLLEVLVLAAVGVVGAGWLLWRIRRVVSGIVATGPDGDGGDGPQ